MFKVSHAALQRSQHGRMEYISSNTFTTKYLNTIPPISKCREFLWGFQVSSLRRRRAVTSRMPLTDIKRSKIMEPWLLSRICISPPRINSRAKLTFRVPTSRTDALKNSVLSRAMILYKNISDSNPSL